ncbi:GIY-YIG nuclease family protein [Streptomyces sp. NPDC056534]|uniref:GIY-YIG nuclease family protein n=1 Tax=Streptomyces sp. NPDC056534 TaxID=3345857 RepID=UPI0036B81952
MIDPATISGDVVYVLRLAGMGPVKIGTSRNLAGRVKVLQTGVPARIEVLWTTPGGQPLESQLHKAFTAYRKHGEWFDLSQLGDPVDAVREVVEAIRAGEPVSVPARVRRPLVPAQPVAPVGECFGARNRCECPQCDPPGTVYRREGVEESSDRWIDALFKRWADAVTEGEAPEPPSREDRHSGPEWVGQYTWTGTRFVRSRTRSLDGGGGND